MRREKRQLLKNIKTNKERRQQRVAELYCQQWTQYEIAEELGVTQPCVCQDLAAIRQRWLESSQMNMTERLSSEIAKLDNLERIAMDAWVRSCEDAEEVTTMKSPPRKKKGDESEPKSKKPTVTQVIEKTKGQSGNPAFLAEARQCVEKRCKLLGLLDERAINVNQNKQEVTFDSLLGRRDDPQISEKQAPRIAQLDDPVAKQIKELEALAAKTPLPDGEKS